MLLYRSKKTQTIEKTAIKKYQVLDICLKAKKCQAMRPEHSLRTLKVSTSSNNTWAKSNFTTLSEGSRVANKTWQCLIKSEKCHRGPSFIFNRPAQNKILVWLSTNVHKSSLQSLLARMPITTRPKIRGVQSSYLQHRKKLDRPFDLLSKRK